MYTSSVVAQRDARAQLAGVRHSLLDLHKHLISAVQQDFEKLHGRVAGPGALLQLLLSDPLFSWLRPVSIMLAELEELDEAEDTVWDAEKLADIRNTIEHWITDTGDGNEFTTNYLAFLQNDPELVMAHAALRRQLSVLPKLEPRRADATIVLA